ncbi:hypothetical protein JCM9279_000501 [Rhodotorula babjevae]
MPASLDKLPEELLKLILDHVDAADKSWQELGLDQGAVVAPPPEQQPDGEDDGDDTCTDVVKGRWTSWYGRGVFALAHVDKRWNALARAILFKSVKWDRIATPFFQLFVLGEPLGDHVKEVNLAFDAHEVPCLAIACALRKLPKLDTLRLNLGVNDFKDYMLPSDDLGHLESSAVAALGRVSSLQQLFANGPRLFQNLLHVDSKRLRALSITFKPGSVLPSLSDLLVRFDALREVTLIFMSLRHMYSNASGALRLVRRLKIQANMSLEDGLRLASRLAPQVDILTLVCTAPARAGQLLDVSKPLDDITLPQLRRLVVEGALTPSPALLLAEVFPRLEAYHIALSPAANPPPSAHDTLLPPARLPPCLREVVVDMPTEISDAVLSSMSALEGACERHDVASRVRWPFVRAGPHALVLNAPPALVRSRASQVCATLSWATERTRWLGELGDLPGLDEMAAAVERLRERREIERS